MATVLPRASEGVTQRRIWVDLLLYPGHTLPTAAAPVIVAIGLAVHDRVFAPGPVLAAFVVSWLVHVGGVFTDNLVLITRHAEVPEHPELLEALRSGALTTRGLRAAAFAWFAAALALAPYLAGVVGWQAVMVLGIVGTLSAILYSAGPLPYTRLGVADPVFFAMFALVAVPAAYGVQAAAHAGLASWSLRAVWEIVPREAFVVGVPIGALVTNVLLIDEIRDVEFDRMKGWRTGAVRFGRDWARMEIVLLTIFAYLMPVWLWRVMGFGAAVLLPLLTLPWAVTLCRRVLRSESFAELMPLTPRGSRLSLHFALLLGLGLAMA